MSGRLKLWTEKLVKFGFVGAIVTVLSLTANFIFLKYLRTSLIPTYVIIYFLSILLSFLLNSKFTFQTGLTYNNLVRYYSIYLMSMIIGVIMLNIFKFLFDFENWIYPFMVIPFTTLWNFTVANKKLKNVRQ